MKRCYIVLMVLTCCLSLLSCGKQARQQAGDGSVPSDNPSPSPAASPTDVGQAGEDKGMDSFQESTQEQEQTGIPTATLVLAPTVTSVPVLTEIPSCTPSPKPSPIPPAPTLPPLDITLVEDEFPWDTQALPETDHVYIVRFIPTERDDLLVAYEACVDISWDENIFYDDQKRPKLLHTWWVRDDTFYFVPSTWEGACPGLLKYGKEFPDHIAQDISRWEDMEPGMYDISYDLFRWMVKWYEPIWWCGVKDEEIVYVRLHREG